MTLIDSIGRIMKKCPKCKIIYWMSQTGDRSIGFTDVITICNHCGTELILPNRINSKLKNKIQDDVDEDVIFRGENIGSSQNF